MQPLETPGAIPVVMSPGRLTQYAGLSYDPNTGIITSRTLQIQKGGVAVGTRGILNLIEGSNVTITATDNPANSRTDVTIAAAGGGGGSGTVTSVSVTTANGVSGSVATATTTPAISLSLGAITPSSVAAVGTVTGSNLSGTNTGDQTSVSGNAGTATTLQTARNINGVSFNGSADITVPAAAGTLSGVTLAAGVTASSLTSFGTSPTLTTPSIAGFNNAAHTHQDAAGGGTLNAAAIAAGTVSTARLGSGSANSSTFLRGDQTWAAPSGSGTVTSVSVVTANGVSGSVATDTTTPAITLTLGAITPSSVAATGNVTGTNLSGTNTGDQTSVSGNAGSATVLATPRAIYGNNFDGSAALTQVIASTYGGTGNGFAKFSGPTATEKTFTLPDATATILTSNAVVTIGQGGTGTGSTLTGLVRGSGSAMTAAELSGDATTSGSNAVTVTSLNGVSLGGLATGVLKNTTGTGAPSIATAGTDYVIPSGSVATLTTPRNINGVAFNGSADITVTAAAGTLSGATLAAGVTASSLTSFGTSPTISGFTNANHTHADAAGGGTLNASAIAAGTMATARLGSGTANSTTFLRGDQTWATPGGGSDPWVYVVLGSDFTTSSATAVAVTGMEFTPASSTKYEIEATLFTRTATATVGVRPGVGWPTAGVTDGVAFIQQTSAAGTNVLQNGNFNAAVLAPVGGLPNTTQSYPGFINSSLIMTTGATGTWRVQVASETAGTTVTIKAGSYLKYRTYA